MSATAPPKYKLKKDSYCVQGARILANNGLRRLIQAERRRRMDCRKSNSSNDLANIERTRLFFSRDLADGNFGISMNLQGYFGYADLETSLEMEGMVIKDISPRQMQKFVRWFNDVYEARGDCIQALQDFCSHLDFCIGKDEIYWDLSGCYHRYYDQVHECSLCEKVNVPCSQLRPGVGPLCVDCKEMRRNEGTLPESMSDEHENTDPAIQEAWIKRMCLWQTRQEDILAPNPTPEQKAVQDKMAEYDATINRLREMRNNTPQTHHEIGIGQKDSKERGAVPEERLLIMRFPFFTWKINLGK